MVQIVYICSKCGGKNIVSDASAVWSVEKQDWVLSDVCDGTYCEDCQDECRIDERELTLAEEYEQLPDEDQ